MSNVFPPIGCIIPAAGRHPAPHRTEDSTMTTIEEASAAMRLAGAGAVSSDAEHNERMGLIDRTVRFGTLTPPELAEHGRPDTPLPSGR